MSAIRVESLRVCWIEAFVKVVKLENISAAARSLGIAQSMVSRYIQYLEKWLGKKLIEPGKINDPEDARISIGITEDGLQFFDVAEAVLGQLSQSRTQEAKSKEQLDGMEVMITKLNADLYSRNPTETAKFARSNIDLQTALFESLSTSSPLNDLVTIHRRMRDFFVIYEQEVTKETRRKRRKVALRKQKDRIDPRTITVPVKSAD